MLSSLLSLCFLFSATWAAGQTRIFIDQVPEYHLLSSRAELPLSTIVRDMSLGCGDGQQTTSYACFCYQSSIQFSSKISTELVKQCSTTTSQISEGLDVFDKYCQLGSIGLVTTDATNYVISSHGATPAATNSLPTPTGSASHNSSSPSPRVVIAVSVVVPVVTIAFVIFGIWLWLKHRRSRRGRQAASELSPNTQIREINSAEPYYAKPPMELHHNSAPQELDASAMGVYTGYEHPSEKQVH